MTEQAHATAAYIRVSTPSQDHAYQRAAIERAAAARAEPIDRWFADVASGRSLERRELKKLRSWLATGAVRTVWVWRVDRLTRSGIGDTLELVREIRAAGAVLRSVADGYAVDGSPLGELVLAVMAWAAQMEADKIAENQQAARQRMESQGRAWGRPRVVDEALRERVRELARDRELGARAIARAAGVSQTTVRSILGGGNRLTRSPS